MLGSHRHVIRRLVLHGGSLRLQATTPKINPPS